MSKLEKTSDAIALLHRWYTGDEKELQEALREEHLYAAVAQQIYSARKRAGLNQKQLAERVGTTQSVISRLEDADYGKHSLQMLHRIADALHERLEVTISPTGEINTTAPEDKSMDLSELPDETIREIRKRDWIPLPRNKTEARDILQTCFAPRESYRFAARQGNVTTRKGNPQAIACWLRKLEIEAENMDVGEYDAERLKNDLPELVKLSAQSDGPEHVPDWLRARGVRLIFVKHLPKTYLDGAAMLADDGNPIIGITLRMNRLDNFWFTLFHEIGHVLLHQKQLEEGAIVDEDIDKRDGEVAIEDEANRFAENAWVLPEKWREFKQRSGKHISKKDIAIFAKEISVTPALVAGRIQHELGRHTHFKEFLEEGTIRERLVEVLPVY